MVYKPPKPKNLFAQGGLSVAHGRVYGKGMDEALGDPVTKASLFNLLPGKELV